MTSQSASLSNTVEISNKVRQVTRSINEADISDAVSVSGDFVQYDTWRPIIKSDNSMYIVCRTPVGDHDDDLTNLTLWTISSDGDRESPVLGTPSDEGWDGYSHPEWSPAGNTVVLAVETSTEFQIQILDASGWIL